MKTLALLSQKGGTGKTTLATQLATHAVQADEVVCLIDIDPQGSAFLWRSHRKANTPIVLKALPENLPIMISNAAAMGVTLLMVDTPPHTDKSAIEAIRAVDFIICPTKPELFSLSALADTIRLLDLAQSKQKALAVINDLPTAKSARPGAEAMSIAALSKFDIKIADTTIGHSDAIVAAIADGKGITETSGRSAPAKEIRALWEEINEKWPLPLAKTQATL